MHENITSEEQFYVVNKLFWDAWSAPLAEGKHVPSTINNE